MRLSFLFAALMALPLALSAQTVSSLDMMDEVGSNDKLVVVAFKGMETIIPDSRIIDYSNVRQDSNVPDAELFQRLVQAMGINQDSKVIITEEGTQASDMNKAARLYWTFKYYGFNNAYILEGGIRDYSDMGGEVTEAPRRAARVRPGNFETQDPDMSIYASTDDVKKAIADGATVIDIRDMAQYLGLSKDGHIPGAKTASYELYYSTGTVFHSVDDLKALFENLKIDLSNGAIVYCNSGNIASNGWFTLSEKMGIDNIRLYDESLGGWDGDLETKLAN
jgi:thiosulfate/3-mercaptopyruvate sulfurtransferase